MKEAYKMKTLDRINASAKGLYEWFWYHTEFWLDPIDRRPYTLMIRDFYHNAPLWTLLIVCIFSFCLGRWWWHIELRDFFIVTAMLMLGVILGHLFWGEKWIPGEQEEPPYMPSDRVKKWLSKNID